MGAKSLITPGNSASYRGTRAVVRHPSVTIYSGKPLSQGQVFMMHGAGNDDRLVRLGFVQLLNEAETFGCRVCGANFSAIKNGPSGQTLRDRHAIEAHEASDGPVIGSPKESDIARIHENSLIGSEPDPTIPDGGNLQGLYLDQTAAERGVNADTPIQVSTL